MHGTKSINDPPPANAITQLPAGGTIDFEITGNKAFTSMGRGLWINTTSQATVRSVPNPWRNDMGGGSSNIHSPEVCFVLVILGSAAELISSDKCQDFFNYFRNSKFTVFFFFELALISFYSTRTLLDVLSE